MLRSMSMLVPSDKGCSTTGLAKLVLRLCLSQAGQRSKEASESAAQLDLTHRPQGLLPTMLQGTLGLLRQPCLSQPGQGQARNTSMLEA